MIRILPPSDGAVIRAGIAAARANLDGFLARLPKSEAPGASVQVGCAAKHDHTRDCPEGPADPKAAKAARDLDCERGAASLALDAAMLRYVEQQRGVSACCPREAVILAVEMLDDVTDSTLPVVPGLPDSFTPWTAKEWKAAAKRTASRLAKGEPLS